MSAFELAQLNIARLAAPLDSPLLEDFVNNLDRVNEIAEQSPGFVWRLQTEDGDATAIRHFGDDMLVNMSVWKDVESLHAFVYGAAHIEILRRRREWFEKMRDAFTVLWWVPAGHQPTLDEAESRLEQLKRGGPTAAAFDFRHAYPPPDDLEAAPTSLDDACPAT